MTIGKDEAKELLVLPLEEITDDQLAELLTIPPQFLPRTKKDQEVPYLTVEELIAEKVHRLSLTKPSITQVVGAAADAISLQMMINYGQGLYPILDQVGRYQLREELKRREATFQDLFERYNAK